MCQSFNSTIIPASTQPIYFPMEAKALPDSFEYDNDLVSTKDFIEDSQTTGFWCCKTEKLIMKIIGWVMRKTNYIFLFQ